MICYFGGGDFSPPTIQVICARVYSLPEVWMEFHFRNVKLRYISSHFFLDFLLPWLSKIACLTRGIFAFEYIEKQHFCWKFTNLLPTSRNSSYKLLKVQQNVWIKLVSIVDASEFNPSFEKFEYPTGYNFSNSHTKISKFLYNSSFRIWPHPQKLFHLKNMQPWSETKFRSISLSGSIYFAAYYIPWPCCSY